MKITQITITILFYLCLVDLVLAQETVDKSAATMDIIQGFTDKFGSVEQNKKYFSPDLTVYWPAGGKSDFEQFWTNNYSRVKENARHEVFEVEIREAGNETFAFFEWQATIKKNEQNPDLVGTVARVPIAYRMVWEDEKIKNWYLYWDNAAIQEQREAGH